jgi:hypothetical protein
MTLNANKLFLATVIVFAVLWVVCSALVAVAPDMMLAATGFMVHAEFETFRFSLTGAGFVGGLVLWSLIPGITVWLIVVAYNRLAA